MLSPIIVTPTFHLEFRVSPDIEVTRTTILPWGFPRPSWCESVEVDADDYLTMVTLRGTPHTAAESVARIEKVYLIAHHDGDDLSDCPESVVTGDLEPEHTVEQALQLAEVLRAAASELRDYQARL